MDKFVLRGAQAPPPCFKIDEAKENKRKFAKHTSHNVLPAAPTKKSKFTSLVNVPIRKMGQPLGPVSRNCHPIADPKRPVVSLQRERPENSFRLKDLERIKAKPREVVSIVDDAVEGNMVELSDDEDAPQPLVVVEAPACATVQAVAAPAPVLPSQGGNKETDNNVDMDIEGIDDWEEDPQSEWRGLPTYSTVSQLAVMRQASMAEYVRRTNRRASIGDYLENSRCYDPYQQRLVRHIARGATVHLGKPPHITPFHLSHVLSQRCRLVESIRMGAPMPPLYGSCSKIRFDTDGVLFAVGHADGSIAVYDMDECLKVAQQCNAINSNSHQDIEEPDSDRTPESPPVREVEPVCRLSTHKRADVVDIAWLPRCARPRKASVSSNPHIQKAEEYNADVDTECLLAVALANDPFVYLFDAETCSGRPCCVLEHADGRTHGGSNTSILYVRAAASYSSGGGAQTAPRNHRVLAGSRNGIIRMWNFSSTKRPLWALAADPIGASDHIGSVLSLRQIILHNSDVYKRHKAIGKRGDSLETSMSSLSVDPYVISTDDDGTVKSPLDSRPQKCETIVVSVTSRGILCIWDVEEANCRGNQPAFGTGALFHPVHLHRMDLVQLLENGPDSVLSVSYQETCVSGRNVAVTAVVKFVSSSVLAIDLSTCCVEFAYVSTVSKPLVSAEDVVRSEPKCREIGVISADASPRGTQVVVDCDDEGALQVRNFHDHKMDSLETTRREHNSAGGSQPSAKSVYGSNKNSTDSADSAEKSTDNIFIYPRFTVPGQVWSTSTRSSSSDENDKYTVIECSEDISQYIGFAPSKSKYIWLQYESAYRSSTDFNNPELETDKPTDHKLKYVQYLLGQTPAGKNAQGYMYTVRSVMKNSIELYEEYDGPPVNNGYPVVQLRTDAIPKHYNLVEGTSSDQHQPGKLSRTYPQNSRSLPHSNHTERPTALAPHPCLPYVICGLANGSVRLLSSDIS